MIYKGEFAGHIITTLFFKQFNTINILKTMDVKTSAQLLQRHLIHHDKAKAQVKLIGKIL